MKVLVTGGTGFIGSHVVRALLHEGYDVRVLHLPGDKMLNLKGLQLERLTGDITDIRAVERAISGCQRVFHVAALYAIWLRRPEKLLEVNVEGTRNVLEAAAQHGVEKVVYTSSIAVFGGQGLDKDATEKSPFRLGQTGDLYSISKYSAHQVALSYAKRGLDITIVAPTGPIGPGDIGPTPTGKILLAAYQAPIGFSIDTISNFADVRDMAQGHVLAAEKGLKGETYLLGTRNLHTRELQKLVQRAAGRNPPIIRFPHKLVSLASYGMTHYSQKISHKAPLFTPATLRIMRLGLRADCSKAVQELGLPQNPIERAIRDSLGWYAENGYMKRTLHFIRRKKAWR